MSEKNKIVKVPTECLSSELAAIWSGWKTLGDREVMREASAKGTHIGLALKCIAHRKKCALEQAQDYFYSEVTTWVDELLEKRQIFRASHILKNVGKNPIEYISTVCLKCKDPSLRDHLAQHVINCDGFKEQQVEAWQFSKYIVQYEKGCMIENSLSSSLCIDDIVNLSDDIKQSLSLELYFHIFEANLLKKITNTVLWEYLLSNNQINMIKCWLDIFYNKEMESDSSNEPLKILFKDLVVTPAMIELIESSDASLTTKHLVLNHLGKYGIFMEKEKHNIKLILNRIFGNASSIKEFKKSCATDDEKKFMEVIEEQTTIEPYLRGHDDDPNLHEKMKKLYKSIFTMCNAQDNYEIALLNGIFQTIHYLSDDLESFLKDNYLITLLLIYLKSRSSNNKEKQHLRELLIAKNGIEINNYIIPWEILQSVLERIPILHQIINDNFSEKSNTTVYELLDGYENINVKRLFEWRFNNKPMPNFSEKGLVKKYGSKESLNYMYYLKESRPNMAIMHLKRNQNKTIKQLSLPMKLHYVFNAHIFAMRNLSKPEIVCGCISFIQLLGVNAEDLRLHCTVAAYVQKHLNISVGNLLESVVRKNKRAVKIMTSYLDHSFSKSLSNSKLLEDSREFIDQLKDWDVIVKFARAHNAFLPDSLLKFLANHNRWLEFIICGHTFSYPLDQLFHSVEYFENPNTREHLSILLKNADLPTSPSKKYPPQVQVGNFNLGFTRTEKSSNREEINSVSSFTTSDSPVVGFNEKLTNEDLWSTIIKCHQSQDPPGALLQTSLFRKVPIFIVFATFYEPSSIVSYCFSWMLTSVAGNDMLCDYSETLEHQIWSADTIVNLMQQMISFGCIDTLSRAFRIFLPTHPLNLFFKFLLKCVKFGTFKNNDENLLEFQSHLSDRKNHKILNWQCIEAPYMENLHWIRSVTVKCIFTAFQYSFQSLHLQKKFLNTLVTCNFDHTVDFPNFRSLLETIKLLLKTNVKSSFELDYMSIKDGYDLNAEFERIHQELIKKEKYSIALELCKVTGLDSSEVILIQYRGEVNKSTNKGAGFDNGFWKNCAQDFKTYGVPSEKAAEFFIEHAKTVTSHYERYEILKLALDTLRTIKTEQKLIDTLELAMWKSCISINPTRRIVNEKEDEIFQKLKTQLMPGRNELQISCPLTDSVEKNSAKVLIDTFIDVGELDTALRINAIFDIKHKDLQILMLCLSLAEGEILPNELTPQQKNLLINDGSRKQKYTSYRNRGLQKFPSTSSLNNGSLKMLSPKKLENSNMEIEESKDFTQRIECLLLIETFLGILEHGHDICLRIFLCYKLSIQLNKNYESLLVLNNSIQFLQHVMESNHDNKLEIANNIIKAYKVRNESLAIFLAQNIISSISTSIVEENDGITMWGYSLNANFHLIMDLCTDTTILGNQLLKMAHKISTQSHGEKKNSITTLKIIVEVIIKSHDCFTTSCNMEGIASILRKSQQLANSLKNLQHWNLLVRLLCGVGRFTEMSYIFQILKENDQFEFLLTKNHDKVTGFKTALIEFLKRNYPQDKALFTLVALHHRLYNEIAFAWENEAKKVINDLIDDVKKKYGKSINSSNSNFNLIKDDIILERLQEALTSYTHATEYYLQDKRLNLANRSSYQTQLIALQISLINGVQQNHQTICVLNLKCEELDRILCHVLNFSQALIVIRAYDHHVDWGNSIYTHCVLNGESKYLKEFMDVKELTSALVQECARRYRLEKSISPKMTQNMQMLISELSDIECKYVLASQLGFKTLIENMLSNPMIGAYLKDTVWKKGYNISELMSEPIS